MLAERTSSMVGSKFSTVAGEWLSMADGICSIIIG